MVKVKIIMSNLNLSVDSPPRYSFHAMKLLTRSGFATFVAIYQHLASTTGRNHDNCCLKSGGYQLLIEQNVLHGQPQGTCERAMGENRISEGMICAFGVGKDTCQVIYYIIAIVIRMAMI